MSIYILGISAFYHDSASCLLKDGELIAAAQEERFSRIKHDSSFPISAINFCLEKASVEFADISAVAFYDDPVLTFDRIVNSSVTNFPQSEDHFLESASSFLKLKPNLEKLINDYFKITKPTFYCRHHFSHAASAFYPSPFKDAAIICVDGVGEWNTTSISHGYNTSIKSCHEINFPHSLGLLYSAFTYYCGFKVNSGEYKLMGLAPYGEPSYVAKLKDHIIDIKEDGSFCLNMEYFDYQKSNFLINDSFCSLLGGAPRKPESKITIKELNLANSIQKVTEEVMLKLSHFAKKEIGSSNLCLAGGVALNCVANGKILSEGLFDNIWIQPASGDAGGCIGAAYLTYLNYYNGRLSKIKGEDLQSGSLLGPSYSNPEITNFLNDKDAKYQIEMDDDLMASKIAISEMCFIPDKMFFKIIFIGFRSSMIIDSSYIRFLSFIKNYINKEKR